MPRLFYFKAEADQEECRLLDKLCMAAKEGDDETCEQLLPSCANVNANNNKEGWTPLHMAVYYNQITICRLLFQYSANEDVRTHTGQTPLHLAASQGHLPLCQLLCDRCADIDKSDYLTEQTALHIAAAQGHLSICQFLVKQGAVLDKRDLIGRNAVTIAAIYRQRDIYDFLLGAGKDQQRFPWSFMHAIVDSIQESWAGDQYDFLGAGKDQQRFPWSFMKAIVDSTREVWASHKAVCDNALDGKEVSAVAAASVGPRDKQAETIYIIIDNQEPHQSQGYGCQGR